MRVRILKMVGVAALMVLAGPATAVQFLQAGEGDSVLEAAVVASALDSRQNLDVVIGARKFVLVADQVTSSAGTRYWEGHVQGTPEHRVALRAGETGVSGVLDLPGRTLRLGHANQVHWLLAAAPAEVRNDVAHDLPQLFVPRRPGSGASDVAAADVQPAKVAYPIALNVAELGRLAPGEAVQLSLPAGKLSITYDESLHEAEGATTWIGHLSEYGRDYRAFFTYAADGRLTGSIMRPQGELLVTGMPGEPWLVDVAASNLAPSSQAVQGSAAMAPRVEPKAVLSET